MSDRVLLQVLVTTKTADRVEAVFDKHGIERPEFLRRAIDNELTRLEATKPVFPRGRAAE